VYVATTVFSVIKIRSVVLETKLTVNW